MALLGRVRVVRHGVDAQLLPLPPERLQARVRAGTERDQPDQQGDAVEGMEEIVKQTVRSVP
jgi:hypothetical protein